MNTIEKKFIEEAVDLSRRGMLENKGGPFGAVIVRNGQVIGKGYNQVLSESDPTAHAEIVAIRDACRNLGKFQLEGCEIYSSCEPCPMCLGAIYWARLDRIFYANTRTDAQSIGFDDSMIYEEFAKRPDQRVISMLHLPHPKAMEVFNQWNDKPDKSLY